LSSPTFRRPPPSPVFPYTTRFRSERLTRTGVPARHAGVRLPLEATMKEEILRYTRLDRTNHWLVAILFLCAGLSGLALFHPWLRSEEHTSGLQSRENIVCRLLLEK